MNIHCILSFGLKEFKDDFEPAKMFARGGLGTVVDIHVLRFGNEGFGSVQVRFSEEYEKYVFDMLASNGIACGTNSRGLRRIAVYTPEELDGAEALLVSIDAMSTAQFADDPKVDLDIVGACPVCWSGARYVPSVAIHCERKGLRRVATTLYENLSILVSNSLRNALVDAGAGDQDFVKTFLVGHSSQADLKFLVHPRESFPRFHQSTRGVERVTTRLEFPKQEGACSTCMRDGHGHTVEDPFIPIFSRQDANVFLEKAAGSGWLASTWEYFGIGNRSSHSRHVPAGPMLVVNQRTRRALIAAGGDFRWHPVRFV